jgi:GH24 family phage-related lysozyme (muramidase)
MSTFKERIQKILSEAAIEPPAIHQTYQHFSPAFFNYIKNVENGIRKGFDKKTNRWYPHASVEGGAPTIAYGHKLQRGENYTKGITEDEAIRLLNQDLELARQKAQQEVDAQYGRGLFGSLPIERQEMLTDFVFNLGSLRSFPKFTRGVLVNDLPAMLREYKRYTGGRELTGRNRAFHDRYIIPMITKNPTG